jgi:hypothetical protein
VILFFDEAVIDMNTVLSVDCGETIKCALSVSTLASPEKDLAITMSIIIPQSIPTQSHGMLFTVGVRDLEYSCHMRR